MKHNINIGKVMHVVLFTLAGISIMTMLIMAMIVQPSSQQAQAAPSSQDATISVLDAPLEFNVDIPHNAAYPALGNLYAGTLIYVTSINPVPRSSNFTYRYNVYSCGYGKPILMFQGYTVAPDGAVARTPVIGKPCP